MHPRLRAGRGAAGSLRSAGVWRQGSCPVAKCGPSWPSPRAEHAAFSSDLRRSTEGPESEEPGQTSLRSSLKLLRQEPRFSLLYPGPLQVAASRWRISRAAIAARMAASSSTVHGRTADEPRNLLAQSTGRDARRPRPRGCPFFGYFLWASKESDSAARMADEKTQGRETVFAGRTTSKTKSKWIPAFAGMTAGRPSPERRSGSDFCRK